MKVLVNGGINISELDGWWAEAYNPKVGWAIGDGNQHGDDPGWDTIETEQLYNILENEVIPEFYNRNNNGIPTAWIRRMRESMAQLTPQFSADRAVREYTLNHYLPAAAAYLDRAANNAENGKLITEQLSTLEKNWHTIHFGPVTVKITEKKHTFDVVIHFNHVDPGLVQVELFANGMNGGDPVIKKMIREKNSDENANGCHYKASVDSKRPAADYTPRIIPCISGVLVPLETRLILWQR